MKEQPLFAPGDRVVCVDSSGNNTGLVQGKEYTVLAISRNDCCGNILVDVGIKNPNNSCRCHYCDRRKITPTGWRRQTRFVPVDFDKYAEETFHQSLKGKPVNA